MRDAPVSRPPAPPGERHRYVTAGDGTRLFVRSKPEDPPSQATFRAFLCDGILCDGFIWKYIWDDLGAILPLTHWNYRGHGRSALPADMTRLSVGAHADDLMSVRQSEDDPPCVLFGHSMGCQVALESFRNHRKNIRAMVLMCGSYGRVTKTFRGVPFLDLFLPKIIAAVKKNEPLMRGLWARIPADAALKLAAQMGDLDPERFSLEDMRPYVTHMLSMDLPLFLQMLTAAGEHSAEDVLPQVDVPTLIIAGEKDTFTPPFLAEAMAKQIPGSELVVLAKGSHVAPLEQHALAIAKITTFLRAKVLP